MKPLKISFLLLILGSPSLSKAQNSNNQLDKLIIDKETGCYIRYYYFPNLQAYYDNLKSVYYYKINGKWVNNDSIPANYGGYSQFNKSKVAIKDFDDDNPFHLINVHKKLYPYNSKGRFNVAKATDTSKSKENFAKT